MYQQVRDLALEITNCTLRDDARGRRAAYAALEAYCAEQATAGRRHPFLVETLADFSPSRTKAMNLYRAALRLSRRMGEQTHSVLLALGRLQLESGSIRSARRYLVAAHRDAAMRRHSDASEAKRLLDAGRTLR